ncbi:hypothetical protein GIB67_026172 [Kingdonia uniflora]|uniref:Uncharacterized protein n=1 Tax=Kingdonia uniflora TaxID=39325 RepID=A0A7J7M398_9MAGN|nr:hypothetical protein GIB67_026172 [Kingdonia uniflora]
MFQTRDRSRRRMRLFLVIASMGRVAAATTTTTLESGVALRIARCEDEKVDPEKCQTRDPTVSVVNGRGKTINKCVFFEFEQSPELV